MNSEHPQRVTLTGARAGEYVVLEERPDGSLVITPDRLPRRAASRGRQGSGGGLLASLRPRPPQAMGSVLEALQSSGIDLREGESVQEFIAADVDGRSGFLAITTHRVIFVVGARGELRAVREHPLPAPAEVKLARRGIRNQLQITWDDAEMLIRAADRGSFTRLERRLQGR